MPLRPPLPRFAAAARRRRRRRRCAFDEFRDVLSPEFHFFRVALSAAPRLPMLKPVSMPVAVYFRSERFVTSFSQPLSTDGRLAAGAPCLRMCVMPGAHSLAPPHAPFCAAILRDVPPPRAAPPSRRLLFFAAAPQTADCRHAYHEAFHDFQSFQRQSTPMKTPSPPQRCFQLAEYYTGILFLFDFQAGR